jgi:hypothetical protein
MRLQYKGLAVAIAALVVTAAHARTEYDGTKATASEDSPFASGPKSAFDRDPTPVSKPMRVGTQVTPVPEPGEWALMGAGLALVAFLARRNRKKK